MPFEPVHSDHAIVEVAFQIECDRPFADADIPALVALAREFRDDLPAFRQLPLQRAGELGLPPDAMAQLASGSVAVEFASLRRDASLEWRLLCADRVVTVNCAVYTRWARVWSAASRYFRRVFDATSISGPRAIRAVTLEYVDEFFWRAEGRSETQVPSLDELVDFESELVPRDLSKRGAIWHLHQGWFDRSDGLGELAQLPLPTGRILERLNVDCGARSTLVEPQSIHFVRIHHMMRYELQGEPPPRADVSEGAPVTKSFEAMHALNKRRLSQLLSKPMQERIGLHATA